MRICIVHDWIIDIGGAEKCLESIYHIYPSDVYTLVFKEESALSLGIDLNKINSSFIGKLPFSRKKYRNYLPLFPFAIEQFDLSDYDLILSLSHSVAKGVLTHSNQLHISYVCTPIRYAWDLYNQYLKESGLERGLKGWVARYFLHKIRMWDMSTVNRVDYYIAISHYIARRIKKVYGRDSQVIYPPVNVEKFKLYDKKEDFYLTASRMVPYKKIDLIVEAFSKTDKKLVVIGTGPEMKKIKSKAGKNIELLGYQSDEVMIDMMQRAKAFVFAAEEDFGITPVEAQACGTPVICLGRGGTKETVIDMVTGVHFMQQSVDSLLEALEKFEKNCDRFDSIKIRENALRFSRKRFEVEIKEFVETMYRKFLEHK